MPIKKALRGFYPIDWRQLSDVVRFERAKGRCEHCSRPHGRQTIASFGNPEAEVWRDGQGRAVDWVGFSQYQGRLRQTKVILATAHLDHQRTQFFDRNRNSSNLKALCQRCHLHHDRKEHRRRSRITIRSRRALGNMFEGPCRQS